MADLQIIVVTPERTVLEQDADFVALPLYDGEIGVLPNRSPMIGRLTYGEMRVRRGGHTDHYYVDSGFVQVANRVVTVLTNRALPADQVDATAARQQFEAAQQRHPRTTEEVQQRNRRLDQARAMMRVAERR